LSIEIINTAHVVSMGNYTPCATSAAGSVARHGPVLLIMVGGVSVVSVVTSVKPRVN